MKKYFILFSIFFQFLNLFGQTYKINWGNNQNISLTNGSSINIPYFSNSDNYRVGSYNIPRFVVELNSSSNSVVLNNIIQSEAYNELATIDINNIPNEISYSTYKVLNSNGQENLVIDLVPFFKKDNKVYKIESFNISQNSISNSNRRMRMSRIKDNTVLSVLEKGEWFKIKVAKNGVFKLDKNFFIKNGIPTNFNPKTLKIYGNGEGRLMENLTKDRIGALQEIPIKFIGEEDSSFDANDYVLFYAKGPHQWYRDEDTTAENIKLRYNLYDDFSYYFITFDGIDGKRIMDFYPSGNALKTFTSFDNLQFYKKDLVNLNNLGQIWVGENLANNGGFKTTFKANNIVASEEAFLRYSIVGKNASNNTFNLAINGQNYTGSLGTSTFSNNEQNQNLYLTSNTIDVNITSNGTNPSGLAYLNFLQLRFKDNLTYANEQFSFRFLEDINNGNIYEFTLANSSNISVWNVSNIHQISELKPINNSYKFSTTSQNEFIAFKNENVYTEVESLGRISNQNIRSLKNIDYVIVTHPNFIEQANRLANFRENYDKIKTAVVTTEQVYNDFSSGAKDPIAIRDFSKFLKENQNPNLKHLVLFGATTYDPKNRIKEYNNFLPTFVDEPSNDLEHSITTDDYFAMLNDNVQMLKNNVDGTYSYDARWLDIAVGRIPASNTTEAKILVDKIISYYQKVQNKGTSFGDWRTKIMAVTDNDNNVNTPNFDKALDTEFNKEENKIYTINKIYTGAHAPESTSAGVRYPTVNQAISNGIELGTNFLMYYGHGGPRSWAQERIITFEELSSLSNFNSIYSRLPIVATVTCDFTIWDLPQYNSAGEAMLKNSKGGALSMITTNRPISTIYGDDMNSYLIQEFLKKEGQENQTIGYVLINSKKNHSPTNQNHKNINILGDPMLSIHRPKQNIELSSIKSNNNVDILNGGKLQALDFVTITGTISKYNSTNNVDENFNGKITISFFEKEQENKLLSESDWVGKTFKTENKTIYKGTSKVEKGHFTIQFYIPKDINYEAGIRKMKFYAWDENNNKDASTVNIVQLEGINEKGLEDNERPQGKLYMNNLNFANGGITDPSPYLVGCLTDNIGINTSGSSIGHDIVAVLDGKIQDAYILNDYYDGGDANPCVNKNYQDYQKGQVMYQLKNLKQGQHTISLKFWDINNNSNTATLDFVVMESGSNQLHIDKLLNWPNPFVRNTFFHFEHNCSSELDVMVQIFTISGKLVKTIRRTVSAEPFREGYRTGKYAIEWDGLDDFGDKIGKGVYMYKVNVRGIDTSICKGTASAIEKLVILK